MDYGWGDMPSKSMNSTNGWMTSGVECHHGPLIGHTVGERRVWHEYLAIRLHTQTDNVGRGMPSLPFGNTNGWTTSGVVCHHGPLKEHMVG